ncbi:MAG: FMN-binding protein [Nitrococcus sp.]|nr:FMN-binding protein [Nitrococcus sp.]
MYRETRNWLLKALILLLIPSLGMARAVVLMDKQTALQRAFPQADRIERETLFFDSAARAEVSRLAQAPFESGLFTVYIGYRAGEIQGYTFIDTRIVRTHPATFMVVLAPKGRVRMVRVLAWGEPPEYQPMRRWLAQFEGHEETRGLQLDQDIQGISGATFTSRTLTEGVRRALAVYQFCLEHTDEGQAASC